MSLLFFRPSSLLRKWCLFQTLTFSCLTIFGKKTYSSICDSSETLIQISSASSGQMSPTCAAQCSGSYYTCPDAPSSVVAKPVCALEDSSNTRYCSLACTSDEQCPTAAPGSCRRIVIWAGARKPEGLCVTPASGTASSSPVAVTAALAPLKTLEEIWTTVGVASTAVEAVKILRTRYAVLDSDPNWKVVEKAIEGSSSTSVLSTLTGGLVGGLGGGEKGATAGASSSTASAVSTPLDGNILDDVRHEAEYIAKGLKDGNLIQKEIHDTIWNLEHLSGHSYAILHGLICIFALYCAVGI